MHHLKINGVNAYTRAYFVNVRGLCPMRMSVSTLRHRLMARCCGCKSTLWNHHYCEATKVPRSRRIYVGYMSTTFVDAVEVSRCYRVNSANYCFYTDSSVLSWDEAREFCERRNSTLPIITDEDVDNVFHQFIVSDSYSLIQNRSVWIAAHARPVSNSDGWHWIDARQSGRPTNNRVAIFREFRWNFAPSLVAWKLVR